MTVKVSTTDTCGLTPIQVWERVVMKPALSRLPHRKVWRNIGLAANDALII